MMRLERQIDQMNYERCERITEEEFEDIAGFF